MNKLDTTAFRYTGIKPDIKNLETDVDQGFSKKELKKIKSTLSESLEELQQRLYAQSKQSVLIVLQAMDAAGKDSTTK